MGPANPSEPFVKCFENLVSFRVGVEAFEKFLESEFCEVFLT